MCCPTCGSSADHSKQHPHDFPAVLAHAPPHRRPSSRGRRSRSETDTDAFFSLCKAFVVLDTCVCVCVASWMYLFCLRCYYMVLFTGVHKKSGMGSPPEFIFSFSFFFLVRPPVFWSEGILGVPAGVAQKTMPLSQRPLTSSCETTDTWSLLIHTNPH